LFVWLADVDAVFAADEDPVPRVAPPVPVFDWVPSTGSWFRWWNQLPTSLPPLFEWAVWSVRTCADWSTSDDAA
jgi:hypothetical protein